MEGFAVLSELKNLVTGAMKGVSEQFAKASRAIADLAANLADRAAAAADMGCILDIIEMVPGVSFDRPEVDADYLNTLLAAVQMGELTLAIHYRLKTEASVVRLRPITTAEANTLVGSEDKFSSKILIDGESDKPAIQTPRIWRKITGTFPPIRWSTPWPSRSKTSKAASSSPSHFVRSRARSQVGCSTSSSTRAKNCTGASAANAAKMNPNQLRHPRKRNRPTRRASQRGRKVATPKPKAPTEPAATSRGTSRRALGKIDQSQPVGDDRRLRLALDLDGDIGARLQFRRLAQFRLLQHEAAAHARARPHR